MDHPHPSAKYLQIQIDDERNYRKVVKVVEIIYCGDRKCMEGAAEKMSVVVGGILRSELGCIP